MCIEKRPYTLYGRLATLHFRYLTCLLDRGHITLRQACFMVCCSFRPLEVRRHLVNALPKGAVNLVPLRTSTSGSVSEVQYTIKPLLYIFQCIRLRNLRNLHKLKHSNNRIAYNSHNNHFHKTASSYHVWNISRHRSVQI